MRKKWSIINMIVGFLSQVILLTVGLLSRRVFIHILSVEYLGCEGVFSNILHILSLTGCGASAVSYIMIKAVATEDKENIQKAFALIRYYQKYSCILFISLGIVGGFFLPLLLQNTTTFSWQFLQIVYYIYLVDLVLSMWSGMAETPGRYDCIIKASQKQAICNLLNCTIRIGITVAQIFVLWSTHSYIFYLSLGIVSRLIYIFITKWYCYQYYPYLKSPIHLEKSYLRETNIFREIRSNFSIMLAIVVFGSTDNLVITAFQGLSAAGLYSNYFLIYSQLNSLSSKIIDGMSASIGNFVNTVSEIAKKMQMFYRLQTFVAAIASLCAIGTFCVLESVIEVIFGNGLLLSPFVAPLLSVLIFVGLYSKVTASFRHSVGQYWRDQWFQIAAAVVNLLLSILLVWRFGIPGVLIGTLIGACIQNAGYMKVVKDVVLAELKVSQWLLYALLWGGGSVLGCAVFSMLFHSPAVSLFGIVLRIIAAATIWVFICILLFFISPKVRDTASYGYGILKDSLAIILKKMKKEVN